MKDSETNRNSQSQIFYFGLSNAIQIHQTIITLSGGLPGYNPQKIQTLESVLEHIQNDLYYPTFLDKITHLLYSINKNHVFLDGNKRASLALSAYFLEINGYSYYTKNFIYEMENVVVWVADNIINKDLLKDIIEDVLTGQKRESVQLAIIHALTKKKV